MTSALTYRHALIVLRVVAAVLIGLHGIARVSLGIVGDFGVFLGEIGFPYGLVIAWVLTLVEIVGSVLLAAGFFVRPLAAWYIVELVMGIVLTHAPEGSFVVDAGRNGMEYSVLLIVVFALLAWTNVGPRLSD